MNTYPRTGLHFESLMIISEERTNHKQPVVHALCMLRSRDGPYVIFTSKSVLLLTATYGTDENRIGTTEFKILAKNMFNNEAKDECQQMLLYTADSSLVGVKGPKASVVA